MLTTLSVPFQRLQPLVRPFVRAVYPRRHTDITALAAAQGYAIEEHTVTTADGYLLAVHRLHDPDHPPSLEAKRPVVYFHHGLLTNSELFLLGDRRERCLPYLLVDQGYDVWLGNNRGNKYSKHTYYNDSDDRYWDFSLDELARFDIPAIVDYVLATTGQAQLTYIGFSQGTTQFFGSVSLNAELNHKVKLFVGLSPVMVPQPLTHPLIKPFIDKPAHLNYIFGNGPMLPFVNTVNRLIPRHAYRVIVDLALALLFNTSGKNITPQQRFFGYPYLYSVSSVKCVCHWFHIIREQVFCQWIDDPLTGEDENRNVNHFVMDGFNVPSLFIYGDNDVLVDINATKKILQKSGLEVTSIAAHGYEHMDTLWAEDCVKTVFDPVMEMVNTYNKPAARDLRSSGSVFI